MLTAKVVAVDNEMKAGTEQFHQDAVCLRDERQDAGADDCRGHLQPTLMPDIDSLLGKPLDVCCLCDLEEGGSVLRWCQGEVTKVSNGKNTKTPGCPRACCKKGEAVNIMWDAIEERGEDSVELPQRLLPSKWNPKRDHAEGCWRLNVRVCENSRHKI